MPCDDRDQIEVQVIVDVLNSVEARLRERELCGWRLTVPRTRIYAIVLHAVILSARAACTLPATLDRAAVLDTIFDCVEPPESGDGANPVEDTISRHIANAN